MLYILLTAEFVMMVFEEISLQCKEDLKKERVNLTKILT